MIQPKPRPVEASVRTVVGPRLPGEGDHPVASPVHDLQSRIAASVPVAAAMPVRWDHHAAAMRVTLYIAIPLVLWTGLFRVAGALA